MKKLNVESMKSGFGYPSNPVNSHIKICYGCGKPSNHAGHCCEHVMPDHSILCHDCFKKTQKESFDQ
jgi:hypothetical protein